jgi:hypothetical protein
VVLWVVGRLTAVASKALGDDFGAVFGVAGISESASLVAVSFVFSIFYKFGGRERRSGFRAAMCQGKATFEESKGRCGRRIDVGRAAVGERQHGGWHVDARVRWTWGEWL